MSAQLPEIAKAWFDSVEFATIATIEPDGQPQLSVIWISRDGDDLLVSTVAGRRKHRNLERDPRCTVLLFPKDAPYSYVEVRGTASMTLEGGRELIDEHARKYTGAERYTADDGTDNVRVVVRITPDKVVTH
ncbi:MAG: PPOX class F420-dependent oxidoreductase [Actinobacteria bacterium]|jgi:PPOX class probable F420-dependent enzyme|nr:PPOX class F420-dependent oxidoreductase [Actinomycetota bacterium]